MARIRKNTDESLLAALACGATVENAARSAGMSVRTAQRRQQEPAFRQRLQQLKTTMVERTSGMITAAGLEAVKTLITLQDSSTPAGVRRAAAQTILEVGLKLRENTELAERLAALEAQVSLQRLPFPGDQGRETSSSC
jgi:hypothetical protein